MAILHVDMDAFYASVEIRERPELAGKPVIVGGSAEGRGVVSAASYEARKYGVHSAVPMARALRLCPDAVRLPVRMNLYSKVSQQIHAIFARYTPEIEPLSLDEAFLDVNASEKLFGSAADIARRIKQEIHDELSLVASVGIAPNKFLAKIASDLDKPDGFVEVRPDDIQSFLDPLPVGRLWGVGKVTGSEFERLGIKTIAQVRRQSPEFLQMKFGNFGIQLWELAHGRDSRPVVTDHRAKSISNENTFETDVRDKEVLRSWLMDLTEQVGYRLRRHDLYGRTVQIKLRFSDFKTITRSHTLSEPTQMTRDIWQAALNLLNDYLAGHHQPVRLLGVGISGLATELPLEPVQGDLFTPQEQTPARKKEIDKLADAINNRFGKLQLRRGSGFHRR